MRNKIRKDWEERNKKDSEEWEWERKEWKE